MNPFLETPEFLAVGHVTHDFVEGGGTRLGGAALYASVTARRMGKRAAVLTSCGEDYRGREAIGDITARVVPSHRTSSFRNTHVAGGRVQYVYQEASSLSTDDLPAGWTKAHIVYLCPVLHEVPMDMAEAFSESLIGVAPQGWMRTWDAAGRIRSRRWEGFERLLDRAELVIVSEEDLGGEGGLVDAFRRRAPIVVVTQAARGAVLFAGTRTLTMGAHAAREKDPTGAGDCFGAAFLIRYAETGSIEEAGRFASCVGACVVEQDGIEGIPTREAVEGRLRKEQIPCEWKT